MELEGQVVEIIYYNELNSYTICVLETESGSMTAVGYLPFVTIGETLKLFGKLVTHKDYGEQFKIDTFEKIMPATLEGLTMYLGSGIIKGIGPATAKKIVKKFGEDTLNIIKLEPYKLSQVKGITEEKAIEIATEFNEKWELWQIVQFLEKFGIGANNANRVFKELGANAIEEIEKNPYVLIDIVYGIDFKKIDKMAMEIGIDITFSKRIESGIKYALIISSNNGHTCVIKQNLIEYTKSLLGLDSQYVENALINCVVKNEIVIEEIEEEQWVYLYPFHKAETNIIEKIYKMNLSDNVKFIKNIDKELKKQEAFSDIELSEMQVKAVKLVNDNNICVITGGPGTGKTTIIKTIIDIYKNKGMKVILCAPTGRAAKRMTETTGEDAKTIHRLLEIGKIEEDRLTSVDEYVLPIQADVVIIDEMSMVDIFLMNHLLKGVFQGTKLVLVGDSNQLLSVGPGAVLKDIIESECVPVIKLNTIFRQAATSKIVVNAHNVNNGKAFIKKNETTENFKEDFFYINEGITEKILYNITSLCSERLKNYGNYEFFENMQVITPTKKGQLGTKELNKTLQQALNKPDSHKKEKNYGEQIFREGDRVMQVKNNYDMIWVKNGKIEETGTGIFNGELGRIIYIDEKEKQIKILFDDEKESWYSFSDLDQLELAYAITVHKAQRK